MARMKLKDICLKIGSGATPRGGKEAYIDSGISLIRSQNVLDFDFSYDGLAHINEQQANKLNNVIVESGDVLLNITGDSVARVCVVDDGVLPARVNQHVAIVRANTEIVLGSYLLYFLQMLKPYLLQIAAGGATRNALTKGMIEELEVEVPTINEQERIVSIIDDLQMKIKQNKAINENLLQQVQALYREMFVNTQNESRKECRADECFDIAIGKTPPRKEHQWFTSNPDDVTWVSISDMGNCGPYISKSSEQLTQEAVDKFNIRVIPDNTVLLSFKLTVGRIAITHGEMTTNEAIAHFKTDKTYINEYLYCYLKNFNYQTLGSTSSIATAVNSKVIKAMPFIVPTDDEIAQFHDVAGPIFARILNNQLENDSLAKLRDNLLPKLMSGELDVSELAL